MRTTIVILELGGSLRMSLGGLKTALHPQARVGQGSQLVDAGHKDLLCIAHHVHNI